MFRMKMERATSPNVEGFRFSLKSNLLAIGNRTMDRAAVLFCLFQFRYLYRNNNYKQITGIGPARRMHTVDFSIC